MPGKAKGQHKEKQLSAGFVKAVSDAGRYVDGNGLFLQVDHSGAERWTQRLMVRGKRRGTGLGPFTHDPAISPGLTLAQARERAVANRTVAPSGGDPLAHKKRVPTHARVVGNISVEWHRARLDSSDARPIR